MIGWLGLISNTFLPFMYSAARASANACDSKSSYSGSSDLCTPLQFEGREILIDRFAGPLNDSNPASICTMQESWIVLATQDTDSGRYFEQ